MKYLIATLGIFFISLNIYAKIDPQNFSTDMSIYGFHADSSQIQALKGGMRIGVISQGIIDKNLSYKGKINIFFEEGSHIALNNNSYQTATTYGIEYGQLQWQALSPLQINFGVSRPTIKNSPLFINTPSLGLNQKVAILKSEQLRLTFKSFQNVVSTNHLQSRTGTINERGSYYLLHNLNLSYDNSSIELIADASYFSFNELNSKNAFDSRYIGAVDIIGHTETTAKFPYKFQGYDISASIEFKKVLKGFTLQAELLSNIEAKDNGTLIGVDLAVNSHHKLSIQAFENESNTLPSIVVSPLYGGTNRKGYHSKYKYTVNEKSELDIDFYSLETIKTTAYQKNLNITFLEYRYKI